MAGGAYILDYGDSFETSKKDAVIGGVQCVGTEPELIECFHASFGDHNCRRRQTTPNIIISCSGTKHTATVVRSESDCTDDVMGCTDGDLGYKEERTHLMVMWSSAMQGDGSECVMMNGV